jgi:hypothetical protein
LREFIYDKYLTDADKRYWTLSEVKDEKRFSLHHHQEALVFTTDPHDVPSWSQCTVTL